MIGSPGFAWGNGIAGGGKQCERKEEAIDEVDLFPGLVSFALEQSGENMAVPEEASVRGGGSLYGKTTTK